TLKIVWRAVEIFSHMSNVRTARLEFGSVFFFFSSRRRHTRSDRDWSSDVCSSDLSSVAIFENGKAKLRIAQQMSTQITWGVHDRSEERRVGKECRSRWGA